MRVALWIAVVLAGLVLFAIGMVAAVRSYRESQYHGDIEYWREPPDMSPASAAKMADVMGLSKGSVDSLQMTATMLPTKGSRFQPRMPNTRLTTASTLV